MASVLFKIIKYLCITIGAVVLLAIGVGAFLTPTIMKQVEAQRQAEAGTIVQTADADYNELVRVVSAPGAVRARNSVNITSRVSAKIIELPFEAGDYIKEGDVVVRLDSKDLEAALQAAKARLQADEASLRSSERHRCTSRSERSDE